MTDRELTRARSSIGITGATTSGSAYSADAVCITSPLREASACTAGADRTCTAVDADHYTTARTACLHETLDGGTAAREKQCLGRVLPDGRVQGAS